MTRHIILWTLKEMPEFVEALAELAFLHEQRGEWKEARAVYERLLRNATHGGVTRRAGFLALRNVSPRFHQANPACPRDIQDIAPAELADGMLTLIRQNLSLPQDDLYRALAKRCGAAYVGDAIRDHFDEALDLLLGTCVSRDEDGTLTARQA